MSRRRSQVNRNVSAASVPGEPCTPGIHCPTGGSGRFSAGRQDVHLLTVPEGRRAVRRNGLRGASGRRAIGRLQMTISSSTCTKSVGARAGDRALRRALQPPPAARGAAERDAGGCLRRPPGRDPRPSRPDQTRDIGAAEARQFDRSVRTATRRECDLLTSSNGPEDSDDVHPIKYGLSGLSLRPSERRLACIR